MAAVRSSVIAHVKKIWQEQDQHDPDYDAFNEAVLRYLKARYSGRVQSSQILFGLEINKMADKPDELSEFEMFFGQLMAITPGVVYFRAIDFWRQHSGLLVRDTSKDAYLPKFRIVSVTNWRVRLELTQKADGPVTILHSDEDGMSYAQISVQRWAEMNPWLDTWLPAE